MAAAANVSTTLGNPSLAMAGGRRLQSAAVSRTGRVGNALTGGGGDERGGSGIIQPVIRLVIAVIWSVCALLFAIQYKSKVVDAIPVLQAKPSSGQDIKATLCECCGNCSTILHLCFCSPCRAGHTMQVAGVCGYWPVALLYYFCPECSLCLGLYFRSQLRQRLGLAPCNFMDCLAHCFCSLCAIGQEAIEVDTESGATVQCCCQLMLSARTAPMGSPAVVGQAIFVGEVLQKQTE